MLRKWQDLRAGRDSGEIISRISCPDFHERFPFNPNSTRPKTFGTRANAINLNNQLGNSQHRLESTQNLVGDREGFLELDKSSPGMFGIAGTSGQAPCHACEKRVDLVIFLARGGIGKYQSICVGHKDCRLGKRRTDSFRIRPAGSTLGDRFMQPLLDLVRLNDPQYSNDLASEGGCQRPLLYLETETPRPKGYGDD